MKIIEVENYQELSNVAAEVLINEVRNNPRAVLGLATGGTPKGVYKEIIKEFKTNGPSFEDIVTFNLDEYVGVSGDSAVSYRHYMDSNLFNHININKSNTNIPNGLAKNIVEECIIYENRLENLGPIDLQILGIGNNGHIGFNEPGTSFNSVTHVVDLADSTIEANSIYFDSISDVPKKAITMGISSIMRSKKILLLVSGESKIEAVNQLISGEISEDIPASILKNHPNVVLIADKVALSQAKVLN